MKKIVFISIILSLVLLGYVSAQTTTSQCNLKVSLINQDPYPALPNEYVDVVFQVTGVENINCGGANFELIPSYPFSIVGDSLKTLDSSTYTSDYNTAWVIPYTLKVDKDALDKNATIEVHYSPGSWTSDYTYTKEFNIQIQDSRTNFDAVIQEATSSEVSIAIANTGKYVANSVVVRIPEQEGFRVTGTDGQMIGNLDSGDYTIVSFSISLIMQRNFQPSSSNKDTTSNLQNQKSSLKFDIYYTDALGERRIVNMELPLQMTPSSTTNGEMPEGFPSRNIQNNNTSLFNWYILIIILILGAIIFYICKKYPKQTKGFYYKLKQKFKRLFNRKKYSNNPNTVPNWIKNIKDKEKKK